ncbi:unnamed protein product [Euphydryas editha]|uniref:Uncharacterized protein n=1 Tax=Euphydryas editha TaxID=104508 RepID=A0AAU9U1Z8_EUPED|nr:unnamed protein product [Euphydryas editha]
MDQPLTQEESYAERRKLFKTIWETSMHVDEKDDIMNKPKIIKTLRLDEMDRSTAGKKKKQRIKNLRAVCNRLLDFCDRQDADDLFYEQMVAQGKEPPTHLIEPKVKKRHIKIKKNIKKAKSMLSSTNVTTTARVTISEMKETPKANNKTNKYVSSNKIKRTSTGLATSKSLKPKLSNKMSSKNSEVASQKIVKKKGYKKPEFKTIQQGINDDHLY